MARFGKGILRSKDNIVRLEWPRIREIMVKGTVLYQVDPRPYAKREAFVNLTFAKTRAGQLAKERGEHGKQGVLAPIKDRVLLAELAERVSRHGKTLRDAVDAAERVWEEERQFAASVPMAQALDEWLAAKESQYRLGKLRQRTISNLRPLVREFRSAFGHMNVLAVTPEAIRTYEEERPAQPRTIITKRAKLSEFFRFAVLKNWRYENPIERLHSLVPIEAKRASVEILSISACKELLKRAREGDGVALPYVVICLFAGLRPSEAERLDWRQVHLDTGQIEVLAATSKNAESRFVPIEKNLAAWLVTCRKQKGRIIPTVNWRRQWDEVRQAAGYSMRGSEGSPWPDDVLRHSYASYWLAVHQDRARLAEQMGNSVEVIRSHYSRAITPAVAKVFWEIKP